MKKRISLILVLVLVLGAALPTSYAAVDYGQWLFNAGLINGGDNGDLMPEKTLTRAEMMAILARMLGEEEEALNWKFGSTFTDVPSNKWYAPYIGYAQYKNWTTGTSETTFSPDMELTGDQAMSFLLTALGYEKGVDFLWNEAREYGDLLGIDSSIFNETRLRRSEVFELMYDTLHTNVKGTTTRLGEVLEVLEPAVVIPDFELEKIKSDYSRDEIAFIFTKDVDGDTLKSTTIQISSSGNAVEGKTLVEDNIVYFFFNSTRNNNTSYTATINGIKDVEGNSITTNQSFTLRDVESPSVQKVVVTSSKTFDVYFSEDIVQTSGIGKLWNEILIDGIKASGFFTQDTSNFHKWTFTANDKIPYGTRTLSVKDFKDVSGYVMIPYSENMVVEQDTNAPYVTGIEFITKTSVKINFNEPVVAGTVKMNGKTAQFTQGASSSYTMNLAGYSLDAASTYEENLTYTSLEDIEGNKSDASGLVFEWKAPLDTTKPTVNITLEDDNDLELEFSEAVDISAAMFALLDENDDLVSLKNGSSLTVNADNKLTLVYSDLKNADSANYTLDIKYVKDASVVGNQMDQVKYTFVSNDTKAPTYVSARMVDTNTVRIVFSEPMLRSSLTDLDNYVYKGILLGDYDNVSYVVGQDDKSIDITVNGMSSGHTIAFLGLKDANGTRLSSSNFNVAYTILAPNVFDYTDISVEATGPRTLIVKAKNGHDFAQVAPEDFAVRDSDTPSKLYYVISAMVDENDPTKLTLTLNTSLLTNATTNDAYKTNLYLYTDGNLNKDSYNQPLTISSSAAVRVTDAIAPTVSKVETGVSAGQIMVTFSETVTASSETAVISDILLRDSNGQLKTLTSADINLTDAGVINFDSFTISNLISGESYTIQILSRNITDGTNPVTEITKTVKAK